jgi:hypothetical protein
MIVGKHKTKVAYSLPIGERLWGALHYRLCNDSIIIIDELDKSLAEPDKPQEKIGDLASFLDGNNSPPDCVIFLIANDISVIPEVLMRKRRVHYTIKFDAFSSYLIAKAGNYWSEGKMGLTESEVSQFDKKFVGAQVIQTLDDLDREKKLTKEGYLVALEAL